MGILFTRSGQQFQSHNTKFISNITNFLRKKVVEISGSIKTNDIYLRAVKPPVFGQLDVRNTKRRPGERISSPRFSGDPSFMKQRSSHLSKIHVLSIRCSTLLDISISIAKIRCTGSVRELRVYASAIIRVPVSSGRRKQIATKCETKNL